MSQLLDDGVSETTAPDGYSWRWHALRFQDQLAEARAALTELQERPWLLDADLDQWRERHAAALKAAREQT